MSQNDAIDPSLYESVDASQYEEAPSIDASQFEALPSYANGMSPETPINKSPVDPITRTALAMGNEAGNLKYLKSKFENATRNRDGDILVQDKGMWHRLDSKNLGEVNAWEATKKIVKSGTLVGQLLALREGDKSANMIDLATEVENKAAQNTGLGMQIAGATFGAALFPVNPVAGAGVGAGFAEAIRTSLGRLFGTYEATPEQQVKDTAWESLLAAGGQKIALGAEPGLQALKESFKNVKELGTNFAKESFSSLFGSLTDAGKWATRRALDNPGVISEADAIVKTLGNKVSRDAGAEIANRAQSSLVTKLAEDSRAALQRNYGKQLSELVQNTPDSFVADVGGIFKNLQQKMVDSGYGYLDKGGQLKIFTDAQVAEKLAVETQNVPKIIGEQTRGAMQNMARVLNQYSKYPKLDGKIGAKRLVDMKKSLGESFDEFFQDSVPDTIKRSAVQIKQDIETQIAQQFANHGYELGQRYLSMNADYAAKKDAVDLFNRSIEKGQVDSLVKKLVSKSGSYTMLQDEAKSMAQLLGDEGKSQINRLLDLEAAKGFVAFNPKTIGGNTGITVAKVATMGQGSNPRAVAGAIKASQYGAKGLDFLKSMTPKQVKEFLGDDKAIAQFITPLVQAYSGEEQETENLLRQAGVK